MDLNKTTPKTDKIRDLSPIPRLKTFKCDDCEAKFNTKGIMQSHAKAIHKKIRDFNCEFCDYTSSLKGGITNHLNGTHNKVEAYQCNFCLKIINRKWTPSPQFWNFASRESKCDILDTNKQIYK